MTQATTFLPSVGILSEQPAVLAPPDLSLDAVVEHFPGLADIEAIGLTGSIAAGRGNLYSDIDIYTFTDEPCELPVDESVETWDSSDKSGLKWSTWMGRYGDSRVDLKLWPTNAPEVVLAPFLDGRDPEFCEVGPGVQDFVYRLSIAKPLKGEAFFAKVQQLIAQSTYGAALARSAKLYAENRLVDAAGQLASGDHLSARLSALDAARLAADCCLVLAGDYCRSDKWLLRRLADTPAAGIDQQEYLSAVVQGARPGESDAECATRVARWAQDQLVRVEPAVVG